MRPTSVEQNTRMVHAMPNGFCSYSDCQALQSQRLFLAVNGSGLEDLRVVATSSTACISKATKPPATACSQTGEASLPACPPVKWTVLVYVAAEYVAGLPRPV